MQSEKKVEAGNSENRFAVASNVPPEVPDSPRSGAPSASCHVAMVDFLTVLLAKDSLRRDREAQRALQGAAVFILMVVGAAIPHALFISHCSNPHPFTVAATSYGVRAVCKVAA